MTIPAKIETTNDFNFESDQFQAASLPWCQILSPGRNAASANYGLAVKLNIAKRIGFVPDESWRPVDHEFSTGEVEALLITTRPRLVIVRRSSVLLEYRDSGFLLGRLYDYSDIFAADKSRFVTFVRYLIFLVGKDKQFLHQIPLSLKIKGAASASFGNAYRKKADNGEEVGFVPEFEKAYADFCGRNVQRKSWRFHAHGIFCPHIELKEVGEESTALVASTVDYDHPTGANFTDYAISLKSRESALILETFKKHENFGKLPKSNTSDIPW